MRFFTALTIALTLLLIANPAAAQDKKPFSEKHGPLDTREGYFTFHWDEQNGKIWLEIDKFDEEFIYVNSLAAGIGSNDIGLDRNQLGDTRIVYFDRRGPKVLLVQPNYGYRAITDNPREKKAVEEAFARSVLWGFEVEKEREGSVIVDATDFLLRDAHDVAGRLKATGQGSWKLDESRSAVYLPGTLNFPQNSEFESTLTFAGDDPGQWVRSVTPTPGSITVRQHHSFVQLPDEGYRKRAFDPRSGYFGISYQDYSTPIGTSIDKRYIARHRLEKKNPEAEMSEPVEPIIYYLDPGTPEPVRSALIEGAEWWNQAFEAIGYRDAFRVEMLPEDAHPLDVRYNVINWVHRSTRGWSYGSSVTDPRTGEIIKGHVLLGSLRVRQDYLIAEGLLAPYDEEGVPGENPMLEMALARIRQLSAHEVGHTLGIDHNFAASVNNRASVMDYPAPKVKIADDGSLDLSEAYDTGIGEWDKVTVAYGYQDFPEGTDEHEALNQIIQDAIGEGLLYITDRDARPQGGAHPYAHLWDNGEDPVEQLEHILEVRRKALERFGAANIPAGTPMATLEDVLVPIYLYHRFQIEGTVKLVGGQHYAYNLKGDGQRSPRPVEPQKQRAALEMMLNTLSPEVLRMPERIMELLPPRPPGYYDSRELFNSYSDPVFDPLGAAETAADLTARLLFNPERAARLIDLDARNEIHLGLAEMVDRVLETTWRKKVDGNYNRAIQRTVNYVVLYRMLQLAADEDAANQVRAVIDYKLAGLEDYLNQRALQSKNESDRAMYHYGLKLIRDYRENPDRLKEMTPPLDPPPGSPIGALGGYHPLGCDL